MTTSACPRSVVLYLLVVVVVASVGGLVPALATAVAGFLLVNWYFTPPIHTWTIRETENVAALIVFLVTAAIVSGLVAVSARQRAQTARAAAEAETLAVLASEVVDVDPLPEMVEHLRSAFGLDGVALLRRNDDGWELEAGAGVAPEAPNTGSGNLPLDDERVLVLAGDDLGPQDRRVLDAFTANLAVALDRRQLHADAAEAAARAEADELRSALLQAVSHDLRTPLAGIKASIDSLRQPDLQWSPAETAEFLDTIDGETNRLTTLVDNLLDMSRIQAGAVGADVRPTSLDEVVPAAMAGLGDRAGDVDVDVPETTPLVLADPTLLERVVANLIDNALTYGGSSARPRVEAGAVGDRVLLRVVDAGPGFPPTERQRAFEPFHRQDDRRPHAGAGVGLGLAVARGFTRAIGADLTIEDTPGGGTTMVVDLPRAP